MFLTSCAAVGAEVVDDGVALLLEEAVELPLELGGTTLLLMLI